MGKQPVRRSHALPALIISFAGKRKPPEKRRIFIFALCSIDIFIANYGEKNGGSFDSPLILICQLAQN